jgi:hypothetical protein
VSDKDADTTDSRNGGKFLRTLLMCKSMKEFNSHHLGGGGMM